MSDPRRVYAAEPTAAAAKPKGKAARLAFEAPALVVAPAILEDPRFAPEAKTQCDFEEALAQMRRQLKIKGIQRHFLHRRRHRDNEGEKVRSHSRDKELLQQLEILGGKLLEAPEEMPAGEQHPAVARALAVIGGTPEPETPDPIGDLDAQIAKLEKDIGIITAAIVVQRAKVDLLRHELSGELARRLQPDHRALVLAMFRAAQSYAAAVEAENNFRSSVLGSGHNWRPDLLPCPSIHSATVLGFESRHDSELSRTRRILEQWGYL